MFDREGNSQPYYPCRAHKNWQGAYDIAQWSSTCIS
jgi:hypothetical protein